MTEYAELIAKLAEAKGGGDEVSAHVMCIAAAPPGAYVKKSPFNGAWCIYRGVDSKGREDLWDKRGLPHRPEGWPVTTSVDAILALIEQRIPHSLFRVERMGVSHAEAFGLPCWATCGLAGAQEEGVANTPALALCVAFLTALQAQEATPRQAP